jgi:ribosomal protein S21
MAKGYHVEVKARRNEPTEKLIRRFGKKVREERIIEEARERMYYIKPSVKRRREKIRRKKVLDKLKKGPLSSKPRRNKK